MLQVVFGLLIVVGVPLLVLIALIHWRTTFARGAFARARLGKWAEDQHMALHEAKRAWFGADPFPLEETARGVIFRIRVTDADGCVRVGFAHAGYRRLGYFDPAYFFRVAWTF